MQGEKQRRRKLRFRIWLVVVFSLLCNLGLSDEFASQTSAFDKAQFHVFTAVSSEFQEKFQAAWQTIPSTVRQRLNRAGWRIYLAEFVLDAAPELSGFHPRGWPAGATWDNADAVHFTQRRLLVFAEKRRNRNGQVVAARRVPQVVRHEIGHAVDAVLHEPGRLYSATAAFRAAYDRDLKRMPGDDWQALAYFSQSGPAGRQEAFAEAFAILLGGGSDLVNGERFIAAFPAVMKLVASELRQAR